MEDGDAADADATDAQNGDTEGDAEVDATDVNGEDADPDAESELKHRGLRLARQSTLQMGKWRIRWTPPSCCSGSYPPMPPRLRPWNPTKTSRPTPRPI